MVDLHMLLNQTPCELKVKASEKICCWIKDGKIYKSKIVDTKTRIAKSIKMERIQLINPPRNIC